MSEPGADRRRMVVPEVERENWRWYLFELFCSRRRIDNLIVRDLRPLWHAAVPQNDLAQRARSFKRLGVPRRLAKSNPPLVYYVETVEKAVAETLRLRQDGRPARWGCIHLHARVEPHAGGGFTAEGKPAGFVEPDPSEPPPPLQPKERPSAGFSAAMAELQMVINPAGARVTIVQPTGEPEVWVGAGDFMRFEEWEELRQVAHAAVDRQIEWFKRIFEEWYPTKRNPTTRARQKQDAEGLARHLVDRTPPPPHGAERDRLRRFASYIGVDFPAS